MPQDFSRRISVVIDGSLPVWKAMNTVAHFAGHFGYILKDNFRSGDSFDTKDGAHLPRNTQYPIIVFKAGRQQVQAFAEDMRTTQNVDVMYFINEMIETSKDDEIQSSLSQKNFNEVEFLGIGIFGENSLVKNLTKKFSLWS